MTLDCKISYENYLQSVFTRVNKTTGLFRKLQTTCPRKTPSDNLKIILALDGASKELFHQCLDIFQYSVGIAIT